MLTKTRNDNMYEFNFQIKGGAILFLPVNLYNYFNNIGVTSEENIDEGNLTLFGSSLPKEGPFNEEVFYFENIPFYLKKKLKFDNVAMEGQEIEINSLNVNKVHIVGSSTSGSYFDNIIFKDRNGGIVTHKLKLSDFILEKPLFKENKLFYRFSKVNNKGPIALKGSLWKQTLSFEENIDLQNIILLDNPFMHIFAITIETSLKGGDQNEF